MVIVERMIQQIAPGKWEELEELDKKYTVVESRLGFPAKKRYWAYAGSHPSGTLIITRQWDSMAEMEATYEKAFADSEHQALNEEGTGIVLSTQFEFYIPIE